MMKSGNLHLFLQFFYGFNCLQILLISPEFDVDPRAAYFKQMENGVYIRMALLTALLTK